MTERADPSPIDPCEQALRRLVDGEWTPEQAMADEHVASCRACRAQVEAFARLLPAAEGVRDTGDAPSRSEAEKIADRALMASSGSRSTSRVWIAFGAAAAVLVALFLFAQDDEPDVLDRDPVAYAAELHKRVFEAGGPSKPDYELLKQDAALRAEYEAALDHPHSLVRRSAYHALAFSGVEVPYSVTERFLAGEWGEDLETPIEVAEADDTAALRYVNAALDRRSLATLRSVIGGLVVQAAQHPGSVQESTVAPYLMHPDPEVRVRTLGVLEFVDPFTLHTEVERIALTSGRTDESVAALNTLLVQLDGDAPAKARQMIERGVSDETELQLVSRIGSDEDALAFARRRLAGSEPSGRARLSYARRLLAAGDESAARDEYARAVRSEDWRERVDAVSLAARGGWNDEWDAIVAMVPAAPVEYRNDLVGSLVWWASRSENQGRMRTAFELARVHWTGPGSGRLSALADAAPEGLAEEIRQFIDSLSDD